MPVVKYFSAYQSTYKASIIITHKAVVFEWELMMNKDLTTDSDSEGWVLIFFLVTAR